MNRRTIHAILTLCAAFAVAAAPAAHGQQPAEESAAPADQAAAGPKATVAEPIYDAGVVPQGQKIVHDFAIRNQGTSKLTITDVKPACGCTVAEYDHEIAPGATGKVHAVVDTTSFANAIAKGVTVLTDDPANPRLELTVKADVKPYVFVQPGFARFIQPQLSDPGVVEEIVFSTSFDDLKILDIESPFPYLDVKHHPATAEERIDKAKGRQEVLTLTFDYSRAPIGPIADYVVVKTNHPQQAELKLPVSGFVRPMVVVTPSEANFGRVKVGEPVKASMILKSYAPEALHVTGAESTVPGVEVSVEQSEDGRQYNILVTLEPSIAKGAFDGTITLKTDHPKKPTIEIPLKGTVS